MTTETPSIKPTFFTHFERFVNNYSIFVSLGAASTSYFFLHYFQQPISLLFLWLMASSVWIIFTTDHLLDAYRLQDKAVTLRHKVHVKHFTLLTYLVVFLTGFNGFLVLDNLHENFIQKGFLVLLFMVLYLLFVRFKQNKQHLMMSKEILVAIGATLGMCVMPAFVAPISWTLSHVLLVLIFFLIHLANVLSFSRFDLQSDIENDMTTLVYVWGFAKCSRIIFTILGVAFVLSIFWLFSFAGFIKIQGAISLISMLNILALINFKYYAFKADDHYRFWGDFIYLIPGLTLFLSV